MGKEFAYTLLGIVAIVLIVAVTSIVMMTTPQRANVVHPSYAAQQQVADTGGSAVATAPEPASCTGKESCQTIEGCPGTCSAGVCEQGTRPPQVCGCTDGQWLQYIHCPDGHITCGDC